MAKTEYEIRPGVQEFSVTRDFNAPRELVFKAFTDPKLISQWWGPRKYTMTVEKMEARPGGSWRYLHSDAEGNVHPFRGIFHDVVAPERVIGTFEYEPFPGHVSLVSARFESLPGNKTRLIQHQVFESVEDRDGMVGSGMREGSDESMDRLAELLEKMKSGR
jgi:uncharacterized protein YndB with AHSA1/START domain